MDGERRNVMRERAVIVARARVLRDRIDAIFADAAHWNSTHALIESINPDPHGELARARDAINAMLAGEVSRG